VSSRLAATSGIPAQKLAAVRAGFAPRLRASLERAWGALAAAGRRHPEARPPSGELPETFAEMLAAAAALPDADAAVLAHYLDLMPPLRVEQMATAAEPNATLFHTRLHRALMPRLSGALDRLDGLLARAGAEPVRLADGDTVATLYARTYYGGFMPLLYGWPADLARAGRALAEPGRSVDEVIDRHLAAPIVHELAHLSPGRRALLPLYLDECVAGWLGAWALPGFAFPDEHGEDAIYAAPWFAQVGQALAHAVGVERLVAAHAGVREWDEVLPAAFLDEALRVGWADYLARRAPHFLCDAFRPRPWLELIWKHLPPDGGAPTEADRQVIADGLRALCLRNQQVDGSYRVTARPPAGSIRIDLAAREMSTVAAPDPPDSPDSCDRVPPAYWFPPHVAEAWKANGIRGFTIELHELGVIGDLAHVLCAASHVPARGAGFALMPW
jgi:hypothetical protein